MNEMNEILAEWNACLEAYRHQSSSPSNGVELSLLPNAVQLYRLGLVLHNLSPRHTEYPNVQASYHAVLQALPPAYTAQVFSDLTESLTSVLQEADTEVDLSAVQSIAQLCEASTVAQRVISDCWTVEQFSALIEFESNSRNSRQSDPGILTILRVFLVTTNDFEVLLPCLNLLQQDATLWETMVDQLESRHGHRWSEDVMRRFTDESQLAYLSTLLKSQNGNDTMLSEDTNQVAATKIPPASNKVSPEQEIQRRIDQVRVVLPHLGEGFIEVALSCWKANVEETVAKLLEDDESQWPVALKVMDRNLPRRHNKDKTSAAEEAEAKAIAKAAILAAARQEEYEAKMVNLVLSQEERSNRGPTRRDEYDDDYDDQYDDLDGVGNADGGLYDDYEAVLVYNRVAKQAEADKLFWEQGQSSNRKSAPQKSASDDESATTDQQFRGPDKMRGGRIPGRGGGRGRQGGRGNGTRDATVAKGPPTGQANASATSTPATTGTKPNLRQKERNLSKRRDQQKKAAVNRTGA